MGMETTLSESNYARTLKEVNLFPEQPIMSPDEWSRIKDYYLALAPDSVTFEPTRLATKNSDLFKAKKVSINGLPPQTGAVEFSKDQSIVFGNILSGDLGYYDIDTKTHKKISLSGVPVHMNKKEDTTRVLIMGSFAPNNRSDGLLVRVVKQELLDTLIDGLVRPVHASYSDLNNDKREDIIISSFGYQIGSLDWFENTPDGYKKHTLSSTAGAIKTHIEDINEDGFVDILALFAQGDESFVLYLGDGTGSFKRQKLMQFPSTYGSSYFDYIDLDGDNRKDLIYVNGDNADFSSPIHKPYHGLRVFKNISANGEVSFEEILFIPINGAYKALPADFDLDGDLDIAVISHFPDYNRSPEESFLILENQEVNSFNYLLKPIQESFHGKWLSADASDFDQDGDIDLVLGNSPLMSLSDPKQYQSIWSSELTNFMILENQVIE